MKAFVLMGDHLLISCNELVMLLKSEMVWEITVKSRDTFDLE